jgi:hypothetical protein
MRWSALGLGIYVAACGSPGAFRCTENVDCGAEGVCVDGYCAFPDAECPSGLRFGEFAAGALAGTCVDPFGTTGDVETGTAPTTMTPTTAPPPTNSSDPAGDSSSTTTPVGESSSSTGGASCPPDWWDCAWSRRRPIDVAYEGEALADFPVHVVLTDNRIDFTAAAPDGADVRFVQNGEVLPHEIVAWGRSAAELWVRVPDLGSDAPIHLYHGNPDAADASTPAQVWSNGYFSVLHMVDETDVLGLLDLVPVGVEPAPGLLGNGLQFDAATAYMQDQGPPFELFAGGATVSALFNANGWGEGGFGRLVDASDINTTATGYSFGLVLSGDGGQEAVRFGRGHTVNRGTWYSVPESAMLDTWIVAAVSYGDEPLDAPSMWLDGEPIEIVAPQVPVGDLVPAPLPLTIGALATTDLRFFDGVIDEIHFAVERSGAWIAAEQLSFTDQLLIFGAGESL